MNRSSYLPDLLSSARRWLAGLAVAMIFIPAALAGGPKYVAGSSYFDPAVKGVPITWPQAPISYYTDQGSLSAILPNSMADAYVTDAFSRWTAVQTAALVAVQSGHLAEDVNGTNVTHDA